MSRSREELEALTDGVFAWMNDREISTLTAFEDGVRKGVVDWLDAHGDEVIGAIADHVAGRSKDDARAEGS